ncbi:putative The fantastic four family protein [Helianthus annuus]|nr:putative The fantastic four family protein [Helianthus annuus]KAJ0932330.1 putative The fantastic four family protein [Helianthus annuus]
MTSIVCQGLQSCLEPQLTKSPVLTSKLSSKPKPEANSNNGWGFFNVLSNPTSNDHVNHEEVYVHPMVKRSASALSTKSLEMCTESLGTETGSDVSESSDEFNVEERERLAGLLRSKAVRAFDRKMMSQRRGGGGFPPPLTSISGSDGTVKVRPHRENGRLVIKAVSVSNCGTKFEAERANGRLSLSLLRDCCVNVESGRVKMKNEAREEMCCDADVEEKGKSERWEVDGDRRKVGSKTKVRSPKQKSRVPNSLEKSTEFELTKCKGAGNGNNGIGNWSLFRVVIP